MEEETGDETTSRQGPPRGIMVEKLQSGRGSSVYVRSMVSCRAEPEQEEKRLISS